VVPDLCNVSWTRFWVPREASLRIELGGYLADPEGKLGKVWNPTAERLESLAVRPCLALLGEPGIGKTSTVRAYVEAARTQLRADETLLFRNLAFGHDLERDVAGTPEFRRWLDGEATLELVLDSLDEYLNGGADQAAKWLLRYLERGPTARLRLRLTCRTAVWPRSLDAHLASLWKEKLPRVVQRVAVLDLLLAPTNLREPRPDPLRRPSRCLPLSFDGRARVQRLDLPELLQQRAF
jgi:hypothetical protein